MNSYFLAAEGKPNPLLPSTSEIILVLLIFGILFFLVSKYVVPAFEKTFSARRDAIEGGIARAEQAQAEAAAALANYQAQLADARGEAGQIREQARAEAQRIVEDLRAQAQAESGRIIARGEEQLAAQRAQVVRELRGEIGALAVELAEKIVDQTLADDVRVQATVDEFLADLEARDAAGAGA
ncbi:MAG: F0F1 ATP synthase subunit B [Frankiaceae bacterium]|jgi:F-type H+-transporting ATPase subunit b|nr:F0F1 ATP synthase subunit B [Frankiaceae bacterium]